MAGPSTSALPQQSQPVVETDFFSGEQLSLSSQIRRRRVAEESDPEDVVDSEEGGSLYAPEVPEDESSEEEEEKSELRSEYFKKDWKWTSDIRKKMQKQGLYDVYTKNVKTEEEARKMAKGIELMKKFEKWSAECGERSSRKFRNPFGCAQKIVYFILEGTKYNWLNFHSAERVELFFSKLGECGMKGSSRNKYAQGYSRFVKYITSRGSDAPPELNIALVNSVMSAVSFLDRKQKSLATAEMRHRELQRTFNPNSFTIDDYRKLKAGVEKFMAPVLTRLARNRLVEEDHTNLTAYICFLVSFMYGHRPGVPENMTVTEFLNRHYVEEQKMFVILVEKHKTASIKSAGVAISEPEEVIFGRYLSFVRPALVRPDLPEPVHFLLSMSGQKIQNTTITLKRFLEKIFGGEMRPGVCVPTQTTIRHLIATMNRNATNLSKEDRDMVHEYLCHTENTSKNVYEAYAFDRIAAGRAIMDKCTKEAEKCSAPQKIRDTDDEEVASCMDEATRKNVAKAVSIP